MTTNGVLPTSSQTSVSAVPEVPLKIPDDVPQLQNATHQHSSTKVNHHFLTAMASQRTLLSKLSPYLIALRPWSFTTSLGPVALGSCLVYKSLGVFNIWIFLFTCICALSVHAAGNLVNTYVDFTKASSF